MVRETVLFENELMVVGPVLLRHNPGIRQLRRCRVTKPDGIRSDRGIGQHTHHRDYETGIHSAAQERAQRDIADEPTFHGGLQQRFGLRFDLCGCRRRRDGTCLPQRNVPVRSIDQARLGDDQQMSGLDLGNPFEEGGRSRNGTKRQVVPDCLRARPGIDTRMLEERLRLGGEHKVAAAPAVVEWLDPHPVSRQEELSAIRIPDGKSEHPLQPVDHLRAVLLVQVHQGLRIPGRLEAVPPAQQVLAQLAVVVDLAVERHPYAFVFIGQGLLAPLHVDDAQTNVPQSGVLGGNQTLSVRPPMAHHVAHAADDLGIYRFVIEVRDSTDATHACLTSVR